MRTGAGERLPPEGYGLWLRDLERRSVVYANLLVPGDPEATWQHQRRLETWGLCPVPVVEVAQDHRVLGRYLEAGYRYIALSAPPGHARPAGTLTPPCPGCVVGSRWPALGLAFTCWRPRAGRWWRRCPGTPRMSTGGLMPWEARSWCGSTPGRVAFGGWQWAGRIGGNSWASTAPTRALSAYERRAVLAGLAAEAWQAAEAWLCDEFGVVTIASSDRVGPRLYLESLGGLQLAHRGFGHLGAVLGDLRPAATATSAESQGLPAVVAALDAGRRRWLREALAFLDVHEIDLLVPPQPASLGR